jgi:hypothetical protein
MLTAPTDCKVFTPPALAEVVAATLPNRPGDCWLEPCVGKGVFLEAMARVGVCKGQVTAVDLDHHEGVEALCNEYLSGVDFLAWAVTTELRFDRIVGNPPYLSLHRAPEPVKAAAFQVPRPGGGYVPPVSNCWYAFLCASIRLLRPDGGLCFVLPASWEYADYARDLREWIPKSFRRFELVRSAKSMFDGVLDGCVVLIADGFGRPNSHQSRRYVGNLSGVIQLLRALPASINGAGAGPGRASKLFKEGRVCFSEVARVRIGIVTGDAKFFLMSESRRRELKLPEATVVPVVTRARHLAGPWADLKTWRRLRDADERAWLFSPSDRSVKISGPVAEYVAAGKELGCHLRQKTRERERWFRATPLPPADGFMSGMTTEGPWICLNRMRGLTATNTLYAVHFLKRLSLGEKAAWSLALMSSAVADQYATIGRAYSKGLLKFEPKDVMALRVPVPQLTRTAALEAYEQAVIELLSGDQARARSLADTFIRG